MENIYFLGRVEEEDSFGEVEEEDRVGAWSQAGVGILERDSGGAAAQTIHHFHPYFINH